MYIQFVHEDFQLLGNFMHKDNSVLNELIPQKLLRTFSDIIKIRIGKVSEDTEDFEGNT